MSKKLTIHIHKTFFVVELHDSSLIPTVLEVTSHLKSYKYVYNRRIKRMIREEDKSYYAATNGHMVFRFTIAILKDVMITLGRRGIKREEIQVLRVVNRNIRQLKLKFDNKKFKLRDYQDKYSTILIEHRNSKPTMLVDLQTGKGKLQDVNTLVRIPDGWKRLGDIKLGDKVMTQNGTYAKVNGIFPHGEKDIYKVTFYDGRSARCGAEHLWYVYHPEKGYHVVDTDYLDMKINRIKNPVNSNHLRYYVPVVEPEKNTHKDFFIHPYILGCLLGDGGIASGVILTHIHNEDVIKRMATFIDPDHKLKLYIYNEGSGIKMKQSIVIRDKNKTEKNKYRSELDRLGLLYKTALNKFIPTEYLNGDEEQRWELLRGLMDTDGYVGKPSVGRTGKIASCGTLRYATSSERLRDTFMLLVRSLGGIVKYSIKRPTYTYKGEKRHGKPSYVMSIRFKNPSMCVTRKQHRAERVTCENQYSANFKLRIDKIEKIGKMDTLCISVNHPSHLYVCNDYIVTHNTVIAAYALCKINEVTLILVLPRYVEKWLSDISLYTNIRNTDICLIQGADSIKNLMNTPKDEIKYKVFIASITTMNYMISEYEDPYEKYTYSMPPDQFMDHLGVGVLLNDETHQHFHALLKVSLYMNVNQIIGLSATLDSNRHEMKRMYDYMFPKENRISNIIAIDNYIYVKVIEYRLFSLRGIRYMVQGYNHNLFEQCIIRNSLLREDYFEMVYKYFKESYLDRRLPGEKILIFMASVLMCTLFVNYLKEKHPDLDIRRYCEDDPYENIISAEVSVSTVISASTAIDIPKLITVINTISMASLQANLQTMGRLRKIEGRDVWYYYLYTPMIPNQKQMHKIRRDTIKDRTKLMVYDVYPKTLKV